LLRRSCESNDPLHALYLRAGSDSMIAHSEGEYTTFCSAIKIYVTVRNNSNYYISQTPCSLLIHRLLGPAATCGQIVYLVLLFTSSARHPLLSLAWSSRVQPHHYSLCSFVALRLMFIHSYHCTSNYKSLRSIYTIPKRFIIFANKLLDTREKASPTTLKHLSWLRLRSVES
jgi:hypothetical protein